MAKRVNTEEFESEVLQSELPVVVEFYPTVVFLCAVITNPWRD